jgi:hypothetical protein
MQNNDQPEPETNAAIDDRQDVASDPVGRAAQERTCQCRSQF